MANSTYTVFSSNWVITLTATLIGVLLALYLNEFMANRKIQSQRSIATQNVQLEIEKNEDRLIDAVDQHERLFDIMQFLGLYMDETDNLIAPVEAMSRFMAQYPQMLVVTDSTYIREGVYRYDGELNLDLSFPHFELSTITLETIKNSGIGATYGFNCLLYLEGLYKMTDEIREKNKELLEYFVGTKPLGDQNEHLLGHLRLVSDYEYALLELYETREEELKECQ
ncbi:MAG: hypothetical protein AAFV80_13045 [Bacteroidota bacterium]